jgi:hypothetical protein
MDAIPPRFATIVQPVTLVDGYGALGHHDEPGSTALFVENERATALPKLLGVGQPHSFVPRFSARQDGPPVPMFCVWRAPLGRWLKTARGSFRRSGRFKERGTVTNNHHSKSAFGDSPSLVVRTNASKLSGRNMVSNLGSMGPTIHELAAVCQLSCARFIRGVSKNESPERSG